MYTCILTCSWPERVFEIFLISLHYFEMYPKSQEPLCAVVINPYAGGHPKHKNAA